MPSTPSRQTTRHGTHVIHDNIQDLAKVHDVSLTPSKLTRKAHVLAHSGSSSSSSINSSSTTTIVSSTI